MAESAPRLLLSILWWLWFWKDNFPLITTDRNWFLNSFLRGGKTLQVCNPDKIQLHSPALNCWRRCRSNRNLPCRWCPSGDRFRSPCACPNPVTPGVCRPNSGDHLLLRSKWNKNNNETRGFPGSVLICLDFSHLPFFFCWAPWKFARHQWTRRLQQCDR